MAGELPLVDLLFVVILIENLVLIVGVFGAMPYLKLIMSRMITKAPVPLLINKLGQITTQGMKIRNGTYVYKGEPFRWIKRYEGAYNFGGVVTDFLHFDSGLVQDPRFNAGVKELREQYNVENWQQLEARMAIADDLARIDTISPVTDLEKRKKLEKDVLQKYGANDLDVLGKAAIFAKDIRVPLFFTIPMSELVKYGKQIPPASIAAQVDDLVEAGRGEQKNELLTYIKWGLFIFLVLFGAGMAYKIAFG